MQDWLGTEVVETATVLYATRSSNTAQMTYATVTHVGTDHVIVLPHRSVRGWFGRQNVEERSGRTVKLDGAGLSTLTVIRT